MQTLKKYNQNLRIIGHEVWSYQTHVATIKDGNLIQLGYWSQTTQKHINYVAKELGLKFEKPFI
tara:strand:+ start:908 stop:1099 length:192 start_codon:yes stop_codon:yes gene_type:complete